MAIEDSAYARLEAVGRREGRVSTDDIRRALPVDRLSAAEIADVIDRLEGAGIEVDIDPALLRSRADMPSPANAGVVDIAHPAAPAVSAPGTHPSTAREIADYGDSHHHHSAHRASPTWMVGGMDLLPVACVALVAVVLIGALG